MIGRSLGAAIAAIAVAGCSAADAHRQANHHEDDARAAAPSERPPATNPVQVEMRLLEAAMMEAARAFGEGDLRPIAAALHRVHGAKADTEAALKDGTYRPPKNPEGVDAFMAMDEEFHDRLVVLVKASRANDVAAASAAFGNVVAGCDGCHDVFRR